MKITEKKFKDFFKEYQFEQLKKQIKLIVSYSYTSDINRESNVDIVTAVLNKSYFNNYIYLLLSKFRFTLRITENSYNFIDDCIYTIMDNFVFKYKCTGFDDYNYSFEMSNIYELNSEQMDRLNITSLLGGMTQEDLHILCKECRPLGYRKQVQSECGS